jgi:hypothetical protein
MRCAHMVQRTYTSGLNDRYKGQHAGMGCVASPTKKRACIEARDEGDICGPDGVMFRPIESGE